MSGSNAENLPPQIYPQVLRLVSKQISDLVANPLEGIRIIVNEEDITVVNAIIDGPAGTPYESGSFQVRLSLGKEFPSAPPKAFFTTKIFHPNVSRDGEICVNTLKKDWKPDLGLKHVLLTIKCLLIVPNPESALNEEAGKLLLEKYDDYCRRARMMTEIHGLKRSNEASCRKDGEASGSSDSNSFDRPSTSRARDEETSEPVQKKLAKSTAKGGNMSNAMKDKRRTLKRL